MSADLDGCASVTRCALARRPLRMTITISSYAAAPAASSPGSGAAWWNRGRRCHDHRQWTRPASRRIMKRKDDGGIMTDRTYRVTEIVGTSAEGVEPAIRSEERRVGKECRSRWSA